MRDRTVDMAGALAKVGVGLLALPLADLPSIAAVQIRNTAPTRLLLQLSGAEDGDRVSALLAWADALPDRAAYGIEREEYIRLAVTGVLDGVQVEVWTHLSGEHLVDTGCFLGLPLDDEEHALPLGALRAIVEHRAVSTHA